MTFILDNDVGTLTLEGDSASSAQLVLNNTAADGDPTLQFQLSGSPAYTLGVDDSAVDRLVLVAGSDLTATNKFQMNTSGDIGMVTPSLSVLSPVMYLQYAGADPYISIQSDQDGDAGETQIFHEDGVGLVIRDTGGFAPLILQKADTSTVFSVDATGDVGIGLITVSPQTRVHIRETTAATNTVTDILRISSASSGTPAAGIGAGLQFEVETTASNYEVGAEIDAVTTDVTSTSEDFDLVFNLMAAGAAAAERLRLTSIGNLTLTGASNTSITSKVFGSYTPTGSTGYSHTLSFGDSGDASRAQIGFYDGTSGGSGTDLMIYADNQIHFGPGLLGFGLSTSPTVILGSDGSGSSGSIYLTNGSPATASANLHVSTDTSKADVLLSCSDGQSAAIVKLHNDASQWWLQTDGNNAPHANAFEIYDNGNTDTRLFIEEQGPVVIPGTYSELRVAPGETNSYTSKFTKTLATAGSGGQVTFPIPNNSAVLIKCTVSMITNAPGAGFYEITGAAENRAGTCTQRANTNTVIYESDPLYEATMSINDTTDTINIFIDDNGDVARCTVNMEMVVAIT